MRYDPIRYSVCYFSFFFTLLSRGSSYFYKQDVFVLAGWFKGGRVLYVLVTTDDLMTICFFCWLFDFFVSLAVLRFSGFV